MRVPGRCRGMRRRTLAILLAFAMLASVAVAAFFAGQGGPPQVPLSQERDAADRVTLYQNGLAFVELERTFNASHGQVILELPVPTTTITDSIRIESQDDEVAIQEIRAAPGLSGPMQLGDEVVVHVEDRSYQGTLVARQGDSLVLSRDGNTTLVAGDQIEAVEVLGQDISQADPTSSRIGILAQAPGGEQTIRVTYLARGPSWTPNYHMDLETGQTTFFATLTGLHTWTNVSLDLVAGEPNVVAQPSDDRFHRDAAFESGAAGADAAASYDVRVGDSVPLGELHRYSLDGEINLTKGQTVRLPVRAGQLDIQRHYHQVRTSTGFGSTQGDDRSLDVLERYEVENTFEEPLPPGIMRFYKEGTWVGEDVMQGVPAGETVNLTAARSTEVTARLTLTDISTSAEEETRSYRLTVENHKASGETVDLQAQLTFPTHRVNLLDTSPEPTRASGDTVVWDTTLAAEDTAGFALSYERLHR